MSKSTATLKNFPYMPFYVGDFYRSTIGWPLDSFNAHRMLLDAQWVHVVLPRGISDLAAICRLEEQHFARIWKKYLRSKYPIVKGGRQNARLEIVREESLKRSRHGRDAAIARHEAERKAREEAAKSAVQATVTALAQHKRLEGIKK